jgi:serine/threonine protein kinase
MYQMLCGRPPFESRDGGNYALAMMHLTTEPVPTLVHNPDVPLRLDALVRRTLSKNPDERPTASELAVLIRAANLVSTHS